MAARLLYQQVLDLGKGSVETLEQALGWRAIFTGETRVSETNPEPSTKKASAGGDSHAGKA